MHLRPATVDDLPAILAIYNHAVEHTTATADCEAQTLASRAAWFDEHARAGLAVLVVEEAGQVAGWGSLNPHHPRFGYRFTVENSVYVADSMRRRGVGAQLLDGLIAAARARGLHAVLAGIDSQNIASLRLHESRGFQQIGRRREVIRKFDRWLDVIDLELLL